MNVKDALMTDNANLYITALIPGGWRRMYWDTERQSWVVIQKIRQQLRETICTPKEVEAVGALLAEVKR